MTQTSDASAVTASGGPDLLATIVAAARRMVEVRKAEVSESLLERRAADRRPSAGRFVRALRDGVAPRVIAECKRRSPSRGILRADYRPAAHAQAYAAAGAAAISVLTEPTFFDGSLADLQAVSVAVEIPLLRKDFIVDRYQILEAVVSGADAVLLIVGALDPAGLRALLAFAAEANVAALVEVHGAEELRVAADAGAGLIGVNSRNLRTLAVEPNVHDRLAPLMPKGVVTVAESGLRAPDDLQRLERAGYDAFLVGERLIAAPDPGAALLALRGDTAGQRGRGSSGTVPGRSDQ